MVFCHPVREVKKSPFFSVISETIQNQSRSPNAYFLRTKKVYFGLRPSVKFISERKNQGNLFSGEKTIRGGGGNGKRPHFSTFLCTHSSLGENVKCQTVRVCSALTWPLLIFLGIQWSIKVGKGFV